MNISTFPLSEGGFGYMALDRRLRRATGGHQLGGGGLLPGEAESPLRAYQELLQGWAGLGVLRSGRD